jgi:hypothetical protein
MSSLEFGGAIPSEELDRFEWLALEAAWAITKSPYPLQWKRWQQFPDVTDPQSNMGMVIGANLWRANLDIRSAEELGSGDSETRKLLLSRAAGHIGKLAGGLIGTATHFVERPEFWQTPLDEHLDTIFDLVDYTLEFVDADEDTTSLIDNDYYAQLQPVTEAIGSMDGVPNAKVLFRQARVIEGLASIATNTWTEFMLENEGLMLEPGATPRSAGQHIEDLRKDFEEYVPRIHEAALERS